MDVAERIHHIMLMWVLVLVLMVERRIGMSMIPKGESGMEMNRRSIVMTMGMIVRMRVMTNAMPNRVEHG